MNHRLYIIWTTILITSLLLTGCWDQRLLRDHSLVLSIGYDLNDDEGIVKTIAYPTGERGGSSGGGQQGTSLNKSTVLSMTGDTVKDAEKQMDKIIPEKFDRTKVRIIILGKGLAMKGFYSTLDSVYRDLRGPIDANLAVFDGQAKEALNIKPDSSLLTSDLYADLLDSAGKAAITKNTNLQRTSAIILSKGKDIVLPYIGLGKDGKEPEVKGLTLFHDDKMTGELDIKETSMFLILSDQISKNTSLNLKVTDDKEDEIKNFVDIVVRKNKIKMEINAEGGQINAKIHVKLRVEIDEFATDHLHNEEKVKELSKEIESQLEELAERTLAKIQEANNDSLGVGGKVKAYHHATWENVDWDEEYPDIPLEATFDVHIVRHGIIN